MAEILDDWVVVVTPNGNWVGTRKDGWSFMSASQKGLREMIERHLAWEKVLKESMRRFDGQET